MIKIEPLNQDIINKIDRKLPYTMRGLAGTRDGEVLAYVCLIYANGNQYLAFEHFAEFDMELKRALYKGWAKLKPLVRDDVIVLQDKSKPTSENMMRHFGGEQWQIL